MKMKNIILITFTLVLGVAQAWAATEVTTALSTTTPLQDNTIYKVTTNLTINNSQISVASGATATIYIASGVTLTINGKNATTTAGAKPAINVPEGATLIITGEGTLTVTGGNATNGTVSAGGNGAAPAIGGSGGVRASNNTTDTEGKPGESMGNLYIIGNVTINATGGSKGTDYNNNGGFGGASTFAIGGGGGGGYSPSGYTNSGNQTANNGGNGDIYKQSTVTMGSATYSPEAMHDITSLSDCPALDAIKATLTFMNRDEIKGTQDVYYGTTMPTLTTPISPLSREGCTFNGYKYDNNLIFNGSGVPQAKSTFANDAVLNASWSPATATSTISISTPQELLDFASWVNSGSTTINGVLMSDIDMTDKTWTPIGTGTNKFGGIFDGNGYIVSNLTMENDNKTTLDRNNTSVTDVQGPAGTTIYDRAGLIGYAMNATIKNVIVNTVKLFAKNQMGAVCGRIDGETAHDTGGILTRCGSFGTQNYYYKTTYTEGNAHATGGITTASSNDLAKGKISDIWTTDATPVGIWSKAENLGNIVTPTNAHPSVSQTDYESGSLCYTLNSEAVESNHPDLSADEKNELTNGYKGIDCWTQTFGTDPCPRPTNRSRAVYKEIDGGNTRYYNIYKVYFISNGGTPCTDADQELKRYSSDASNPDMSLIVLPTTTRTGYTFAGWYTEAEGGEQVTEPLSGTMTDDITLYAHWTANQYTVTLDKQGGSGENISVTATFDSAMPSVSAPTRTGYSFAGFFSEENGNGTKYYNSDMSSANAWDIASTSTLYANWAANTYEVSFNAQGGTESSPMDVTFDSTYGTLPTTTRTGYTFNGWFTEAENGTVVESSTAVNRTEDHTLYAHWTAKQYTVTLDAGVGTGGTASVTATFDSAMPSATAPSRTGYTFAGYYTSANGDGTQYYDENMGSVQNWDIDTNPSTLYAKWTANTYTVNFNSQKGESASPITVTYDGTYAELPDITRYGFEFDGWYTDATSGTKISKTDVVDILAETTLYAHWNPIQVDIETYSVDTQLRGNYFRTFYDSQVAHVLPPGTTAYKGRIESEYLMLTKIEAKDDDDNDIIPKNVPVILRIGPNEAASTTVSGYPTVKKKTISLTTSEYDQAFDNSDNELIGTDEDIASAPSNSYIFSYGSKGLGFYEWSTHALEAHKAYVEKSPSNPAKVLIFRFEDDVTGINDAITDFKADNYNEAIYNLNGIRLSKPQKGINIINGKKIWVK